MNQRDTQLVLERFFKNCYEYWIGGVKNECRAFELAIEDIKATHHNPYSPQGELLDSQTRAEFIKYKEMDLGGKK